MAQRPTVRWNEQKQRWMAWVRFPDGSRRKVERAERQPLRPTSTTCSPFGPRRAGPDPVRDEAGDVRRRDRGVVRRRVPERVAVADISPRTGEVAEHHPQRPPAARHVGAPGDRSPTRSTARRPPGSRRCSSRWCATHATSTIDRNWNYLNQALQHGVRNRTIKTNPAADVLLPAKRPSKPRRSLSLEQVQVLDHRGHSRR